MYGLLKILRKVRMQRAHSFDKILTILGVVFVVLLGGVVLLEVTSQFTGDIERVYRLVGRADLDYGKTVQETAEYIASAKAGTGGDYTYMDVYTSRGLAIVMIEEARNLQINMGWVVPLMEIYPVAKTAGFYISLLCLVVLGIKDIRDAQADDMRLNGKGSGRKINRGES